MTYQKKIQLIIFMLILVIMGTLPGHGNASSTINLLMGQSVYVAIYSHIYHGARDKPFDLTATLSIRNTDMEQEITIISVDYFDSNGDFLKNYIEKPISLKNLGSIRYIVKSKDRTGGSGAKFIVKWESTQPVNPPLIESIMISTRSSQGISFISRGQVIK
jgi:hypothetical protein